MGWQAVQVCLDGACSLTSLSGAVARPGAFWTISRGRRWLLARAAAAKSSAPLSSPRTWLFGQVSLGLNADHPQRGDIRAVLASPAGTRVTVITPTLAIWGSFANYDVSLSDAVPASLHDSRSDGDTAAPYYEHAARPDAPLAAFWGERSARGR